MKAFQSILAVIPLAIILFYTYKIVYRQGGYKIKFNINLVVTIFVTTMIMTLIKNNVATSVGLLGVISVVRFRVKLKDHRDVAFILWAIGIGVAIGTASYFLGFLYSIVISLTLIILNRYLIKMEKISLLIIRGDKIKSDKSDLILEKYCKEFTLISKEKKENYKEYIYNITLKKKDINKLKDELLEGSQADFIKFL